MNLTPHFSLQELTYSDTAVKHKLKNHPEPKQLSCLVFTAQCMETVRKVLGDQPIKITSGFRGKELNALVGGVNTSQHSKGQAVDFHCASAGTPRDICLILQRHKDTIGYDQLILEPTWVHISFAAGANRGNELTLVGPNKYAKGIK